MKQDKQRGADMDGKFSEFSNFNLIRNKNKYLILALTIFVAFAFFGFVSAQQVSYCCEKTTDGAWCQNAQQTECDPEYRIVS